MIVPFMVSGGNGMNGPCVPHLVEVEPAKGVGNVILHLLPLEDIIALDHTFR